jgi:glycosyltransferase involved in cell wall biosynthesis
MDPLVSILIPAFNARRWITDTIKSAIGQTWPRKEIIVVDDGSTDETLAIAQRFASKEVKVVTQQNQGAAAARNRAFALCQGDYVQWLDADDLLAADKIAQQLAVAENRRDGQVLLSSAWGQFIYRVNRAQFTPTRLWCDLSPVEWLIRKMGENVFMQTGCWLVSRELCEAAGAWDTRLLSDDDGEYFCRVILASNSVRFVPQARVFYRRTPTNRLSYVGQSDKKKDGLFLSIELHLKYIQSLENSDRVRTACLTFLQDSLINFYPERLDIVGDMKKLAAELGGSLETPKLRWKYAWIEPLFGWQTAKRSQDVLPKLKATLLSRWDKAMCALEEVGRGSLRRRFPWKKACEAWCNGGRKHGQMQGSSVEAKEGVDGSVRLNSCRVSRPQLDVIDDR